MAAATRSGWRRLCLFVQQAVLTAVDGRRRRLGLLTVSTLGRDVELNTRRGDSTARPLLRPPSVQIRAEVDYFIDSFAEAESAPSGVAGPSHYTHGLVASVGLGF